MSTPPAPSAAQMDRLTQVLAPLTRVTRPHVDGVEHLPERGALYVGNHTLFAFLDLPFMMSELWERRRVVLRGLGDHGHYAIPVWRDLLELCGMVRGTRENVRALMAAGEDVLVFPGGGDEVFKGRGQKYELLWKERLGFAKLAIEHGYPIVPFSAVGAEEMYDVVADSTTPGLAQVSALMKRLVGVPLPPVPLGLGPTLLPRPERLYFRFGTTIQTAHLGGDDGDENARAVRDAVRRAVTAGIDELHELREQDPGRSLVRRLRGRTEPAPPLAEQDPAAHFAMTAFAAWNTSGPEGAAAWLAPDVVLVDPPGRPDAATWKGREAALARLTAVAAELGGTHVTVEGARSTGPGRVIVGFSLRPGQDGDEPVASFAVDLTLDGDQITRAEVRPPAP